MVIDKIAELFGSFADYIKADYILYGAGGLIALVFIAALLLGGYAAKFRRKADAASSYLKSNAGTGGFDRRMEALPKPASEAWKKFRASEDAVPADYFTRSVCLDNHVKRGSAKNYLFFAVITALVAFFLNLLILTDPARQIVTPLAALLLGVIFALILGAVRKSGYNKAAAAYEELKACINAYLPQILNEKGPTFALPEGATVHPETYSEPEPEFKPAEPGYGSPAKAYWQQNDDWGQAPKPAAAFPYADPQKEDVVAQIERITASGASKQTMLDVAKLLQAERAKAENKTPEQQRRLNAALATLLRAISAANA